MTAPGQTPAAARHIWSAIWRFTLCSLVVFSLWAFGGAWFYKNLGEAGFYLVCAVAFIGMGALLLHPLAAGRVTLPKFCVAFALAFMAYAIVWSAAWFGFKGKPGEWIGSVAGPVALAIFLLRQTGSARASVPLLLAVVASHSLGYFAGDALYHWSKSPAGVEQLSFLAPPQRAVLSKLLWGVAYGIGFGGAIGLLMHQIATQPPKDAGK